LAYLAVRAAASHVQSVPPTSLACGFPRSRQPWSIRSRRSGAGRLDSRRTRSTWPAAPSGARSRLSRESLHPDGLERPPIEVDTVARPVRRDGQPGLDLERLGDEPIEPEAVDLEVRAVRSPGQQVHGQVVGAVRGDG